MAKQLESFPDAPKSAHIARESCFAACDLLSPTAGGNGRGARVQTWGSRIFILCGFRLFAGVAGVNDLGKLDRPCEPRGCD
jgi:hypothetical protein